MKTMSHPANEQHLEDMQMRFDVAMREERYHEALLIVRALRDNGFTSEAMYLWENLYTELGEDYEKLLQ